MTSCFGRTIRNSQF